MIEERKQFFSKENRLLYDMALKNCHVEGLHGIVFKKQDDLLHRMFVATQDHVLWQNSCQGEKQERWQQLSLAVHPHRIDIEIQVITGTIWNILFKKVERKQNSILRPFKFSSHILKNGNSSGFEELSEEISAELIESTKLGPGDKIKMRSDEMHTVFVEKGKTASWFITQSKATGPYDGITYTNHDLTKWSAQKLYKKATEEEVQEYLSIAGIKLKD